MSALDFSQFFQDQEFHRALFADTKAVWEVIDKLPDYVKSLTSGRNILNGTIDPSAKLVGEGIIVEAHAYVDAGAIIRAPALISRNAYIGSNALIRENSIVGPECSVGHCTEMTRSIMFPRARAGHFNFVGHSVVGTRVNLGGGTIISNFEFAADDDPAFSIKLKNNGEILDTGLWKLGAIIGDNVKTGSNCVLSPGSFIGHGSMIFPTVCVRKGMVNPETVIRSDFYDQKARQ